MSAFTSILNSALTLQNIQDNLSTYVREGVNSKVGTKRSFQSSTGMREMVELGPIGSSGNLTKVRCLLTDKDFVIKRMSNAEGPRCQEAKATQELLARAELLPRLPHSPHLVHCFGSQEDSSGTHPARLILLEVCGESLADTLVNTGGTMKPDEMILVLQHVTKGLQCLHGAEKGSIVHGSLKPEHILKDAKSGMWKLGSFGAAHKSLQNDPKDAASDIWQMGILVLTMMFGTTAFAKQNLDTSMAAIEVHESLLASIPKERPFTCIEGAMLVLVRWLLAADPLARPSVEQLALVVGALDILPAPQLALAFPESALKDFKSFSASLVRRTIFDVIQDLDAWDKHKLINKYGEEALRSPGTLPGALFKDAKENLLSDATWEYVRTVQAFVPLLRSACGARSGTPLTPAAQKLSEQLAQLGNAVQKTQEMRTFTAEPAKPKVETQTATNELAKPKVQSGDLLDLGVNDLLDFGEAPASLKAPVPVHTWEAAFESTEPIKTPEAPVPAPTAQTGGWADFSPDAPVDFNPGTPAPQPTQKVDKLQTELGNLFGNNNGNNRFAALQMPVMQQQNAFAAPMANPYAPQGAPMPRQQMANSPYAPQVAHMPIQMPQAPQAAPMPPNPQLPNRFGTLMPGCPKQMMDHWAIEVEESQKVEKEQGEKKDPFAGIGGLTF